MPPALILLMLVTLGWMGEARQLTTLPSDITSINSLGERASIMLDPKLRRALIRVLSKLEEEDSNSDGSELSDQEFFNIFGERAKSEDLGSIESSVEEEPHGQRNQVINYIPPAAPSSQQPYPEQSAYEPQESTYQFQEQQPTFQPDQQPTFQPEQQPTYQPEQENYQQDHKYAPETFPATNPTPQVMQLFDTKPDPSPVEAPQTEEAKTQEVVQEYQPIQSTLMPEEPPTVETEPPTKSIPSTSLPEPTSATKVEQIKAKETNSSNSKHTVEFLQAPLIAAFTVQQDDLGIPRRVIPLNYKTVNQNNPKVKNNEENLDEKEAKLKQELLKIEQRKKEQRLAQQSQFNGNFFIPPEQEFLTGNSHLELFFEQQRIENQRQYELQRLQDLERLRVQEQERKREEERLRYEELERQRLYQLQQERYNTLDFQRSVDLPFTSFGVPIQTQFVPGIELNRVNRQEWQGFVGNPGVNRAPDRQLQDLLIQSGVPPKEDLGIVTKVLALEHGNPIHHRHTRFTRVPSRLIEPPNF